MWDLVRKNMGRIKSVWAKKEKKEKHTQTEMQQNIFATILSQIVIIVIYEFFFLSWYIFNAHYVH